MSRSINKDDVTRKILSNISTPPTGIRIKPLNSGDKIILIIEVQKSEYRPHQISNTGTYYMRVDANTMPAPHHYVEALIKRIRYPDLRGRIDFKTVSYKNLSQSQFDNLAYRIEIDVIIENHSPLQNEEFPWFMISCNVGIPIKKHHNFPKEVLDDIVGAARPDPSMEIVHYGQKFVRERSIGLYHNNLVSDGSLVKVLLKFGGRYSPLKYSLYSIDLSFFKWLTYSSKMEYQILSQYIMAEENILIADADINFDEIEPWHHMEY